MNRILIVMALLATVVLSCGSVVDKSHQDMRLMGLWRETREAPLENSGVVIEKIYKEMSDNREVPPGNGGGIAPIPTRSANFSATGIRFFDGSGAELLAWYTRGGLIYACEDDDIKWCEDNDSQWVMSYGFNKNGALVLFEKSSPRNELVIQRVFEVELFFVP